MTKQCLCNGIVIWTKKAAGNNFPPQIISFFILTAYTLAPSFLNFIKFSTAKETLTDNIR